MARLWLPNVTVVVVDCVAHELTRLALDNTLARIEPFEVVTFSDRCILPGSNWIRSYTPTLADVVRILWEAVPFAIPTSHYLLVQWDGWVLDENLFDSRWLQWDYIGAPWWYRDGRNVGNGGFSLRSTALGKFIAEHAERFPVGPSEDSILCRLYRKEIENEGFAWASEEEAQRFSFERVERRPTFGFHGIFNWPKVMPPAALQERMKLANSYVRSKPEWREVTAQAQCCA